MKVSFLVRAGYCFLSGCAVIDPGTVDEQGKNGIERTFEKGVSLFKSDEKKIEVENASELEAAPEKTEATAEILPSPEPLTEAREAKPHASANVTQKTVSEPDSEETLLHRFPEARPVKEVLKKYVELKKAGDPDQPMVQKRLVDRSLEAQKVAFKEKFPGVIIFSTNDVAFQTTSLSKLHDLASRLDKNPIESVLFQAQIAEGESFDLADHRFKVIKNYLEKELHLSSERMILDDKRVVGDWPEFKMFILKLGSQKE